MRRFILDLDDTLANTTKDLQGDPKRIPKLTLVPGALEFLQLHGANWLLPGKCILLTAGVEKEQQEKIKVLGIEKCFREMHFVPKPEDKPQKLEEIVRAIKKKDKISHFNVAVIGDRLDIEIRKARKLQCVTVRIMIPGGRHSHELPGPPTDEAHFKAKNFFELMQKYEYFRFR